MWLSQIDRNNSLAIDLKKTGGLLVDGEGKPTKYQAQFVKAFDFNVFESCVSP